MDQRISFLTLAVRDLAASRAFYLDGLGWTAALEVPGEVVMVEVGAHVVLSLWHERGFAEEVGPISRGEGLAPFTIAHNVATREEVDTALATAVSAGGRLLHPATDRVWGGRSGYVADPDGYAWEIAWNPGAIGRTVIP